MLYINFDTIKFNIKTACYETPGYPYFLLDCSRLPHGSRSYYVPYFLQITITMTINLNSENCQEATNQLFEEMAAGIRVRRKVNAYNQRNMILVQTFDGDGWCNSMDVNEKDQARMIKQGLSPENDSDVLKYYNQNKITIR